MICQRTVIKKIILTLGHVCLVDRTREFLVSALGLPNTQKLTSDQWKYCCDPTVLGLQSSGGLRAGLVTGQG